MKQETYKSYPRGTFKTDAKNMGWAAKRKTRPQTLIE